MDLETNLLQVFLALPGGTGRGEVTAEVEAILPGRHQRGLGKRRGRHGGHRRGRGEVQPPGVSRGDTATIRVPAQSVCLVLGRFRAKIGVPGPGKGHLHR